MPFKTNDAPVQLCNIKNKKERVRTWKKEKKEKKRRDTQQ